MNYIKIFTLFLVVSFFGLTELQTFATQNLGNISSQAIKADMDPSTLAENLLANKNSYDGTSLIVKFKSSPDTLKKDTSLQSLSAIRTQNIPGANNFVLMQTTTSEDQLTALKLLLKSPNIEEAIPLYRLKSLYTPADPSFTSQQWQYSAEKGGLGLENFWDKMATRYGADPCTNNGPCLGANNIKIGIIDSGVNLTLSDFAGISVDTQNTRQIYNRSDNTCPAGQFLTYIEPIRYCQQVGSQTDPIGHGTGVAYTIFAKHNNIGGAGIASNSTLIPVALHENAFNVYFLSQMIDHLVNSGAKIVNLSLGTLADSALIRNSIQNGVNRGVIFVAASGNCGDVTAAGCGFLGADNTRINPPIYPAAYPTTISVGAVRRVDGSNNVVRATYTTHSYNLDVMAPVGESGFSNGVLSQCALASIDFLCSGTGAFSTSFYGTSFAAPMVTGVIAAVASINPDITLSHVRDLLRNSSTDIGPAGYDTEYGEGLINPEKMLEFVWGRWQNNTLATVIHRTVETEYNGLLYQAIRGTDSRLYVRTFDGTIWTPWVLGGGITLASEPSMIEFENKLYQFGRGTDNRLYYRILENGNWGGWLDGWGITLADPVALEKDGARLLLSARGTDNRLYSKFLTAGTWSNWQEGNAITMSSRPSLVFFNNQFIQTAHGTDSKVYYRTSTNLTAWSVWQTTAGVTTKSSLLNTVFNNRLYQFAWGTDNKLYYRSSDTNLIFDTWKDSGGITMATPPEVAIYQGSIYVTAVGSDNRIYTRYTSDGQNWTFWNEGLGANSRSRPTMTVYKNKLYLTLNRLDNLIIFRTRF